MTAPLFVNRRDLALLRLLLRRCGTPRAVPYIILYIYIYIYILYSIPTTIDKAKPFFHSARRVKQVLALRTKVAHWELVCNSTQSGNTPPPNY